MGPPTWTSTESREVSEEKGEDDDKEDGKVPGVVKWEYGSFILHSRDWSEVRWTTMAYTSFENEEKKENDDAMGERQYRRIIIHSFG